VKAMVTAAAVGALIGTALLVAPASATPVPRDIVKESFSLTAEFTGRVVDASGNPQGIGDLTVTTGKFSGSVGNGTLTTVIRVVAPGQKADAELRDTQSQVQLKKGQIFAQAVNEDPKGKPPETLHIMPVIGGTGAYAGARGTLNLIPQGKTGKYLFMYDVFVEKVLRKQAFAFDTPVSTSAGSGVGSVTLTRAARGETSYVAVATNIGSVKGTPRQSIDLQLFDGESTIFARTIGVRSSKPMSFAILGGTGTYAGVRGELSLSADGQALTARIATAGGGSKPLAWNNVAKRAVDITGDTGSAVYGSGSITPAGGKQPKGDYFSSTLTYPEVDGVTPVIAMVEQGFTTGTMIVSGLLLDGAPARLPVIGGTGEYGGAAGTVSGPTGAGTTRITANFWR